MRKACSFTFLVLLNLLLGAQDVPGFSVVSQNSVACTDIPMYFTASTSGGNASYTWTISPARYASFSTASTGQLLVTFQKDLTFTVSATATESGSVQTISKVITAYRRANASFNASLNTTGYPVQMILTNYSTGTLKNYWIFSDQPAKDSTLNTVKSYEKSGSYTITLVAAGQKGCDDQSSYAFRISDSSSVVLPNIFSPNRDDINDVYKPITTGIRELHAHVFNREGIMVHSWHKVNGFWDGRTTSGEVCQDGVYFIVLEAKGFDGKEFSMKSTITLVR